MSCAKKKTDMLYKRRKTLALCLECHAKMHSSLS
ncbi:hypothetical protein [Flintibacter muris]